MGVKEFTQFLRKDSEDFARGLFWAAAVWVLVLVLAILLACGKNADGIALSIIIVFASAAVGCLVGLIFAVPKANDVDTRETLAQLAELKSSEASAARLVYNTNLVRVSDWLANLLVGLSLVSFGRILDGLGWLGERFADVFSDSVIKEADARSAYGLGLTIGAFVITAILMYMWTAARLLPVLQASIREAQGDQQPEQGA